MFTTAEAAKLLGVHPHTIQRWDREGKLRSTIRTVSGHRRYSIEDLKQINPRIEPLRQKYTIAYCRVSSHDQKEDLQRQIDHVSSYCSTKGYQYKIIKDLGSGINYNKKGLQELIHIILSGGAERVVINYKDRLVRFGLELIEQVCHFHKVPIEIINHTEEKSYEEELVEDILSIMTVSSARLYGARSNKSKKVINATKKLLTEK